MYKRRKILVTGAIGLVIAGAVAGTLFALRDREAPRPEPASPSLPDAAWFEDVTSRSGIDFTYRNGEEANHYAILESLGGGVALIDYDGDGLLDVFVAGGGGFAGADGKQIVGRPCRLYRNLGGFRFEDVTAAVGLDAVGGEPWFYTHGCAVADYDNDGWPDLLVTGYGRIALFHNEPDERTGGRRFREVTRAAGLDGGHIWATSAAFADLDGDGHPDLYVCQYVDWSFARNPKCPGYSEEVPFDICSPTQFEAKPHRLYRNNGNGTFTEVGKAAGLHVPRQPADYDRLDFIGVEARERLKVLDLDRDFGKGLGVVIVDLDGDGRPEIYVANDTTDKFLYHNLSIKGSLRFDDVALASGTARDDQSAPNGSMGLDAADCFGSGRPDLLVANYQNELPALYRNRSTPGRLQFTFNTRESGLAAMGRNYVGFGTAFVDVDNDGLEDLVMVNGHVVRHPKAASVSQAPKLFHNAGRAGPGVSFSDASERGGDYFRTPHRSRGLAVGDLNNDGRPDLVISHVNEPVVVLRNTVDEGQHWLGVRLVAPGHRDIVGAKVTLEVGGRTLTRFAKSGGSYLSSGDRRFLFGLGGTAASGRLTVVWPWGQRDEWKELAVDRYWALHAGGESRPDSTR